MGGRTVTPGFIETHSHTLDYGATLGFIDVYPSTTKSIAELLEKLRTAKPDAKGWVAAYGFDIQLYAAGEQRRSLGHFMAEARGTEAD